MNHEDSTTPPIAAARNPAEANALARFRVPKPHPPELGGDDQPALILAGAVFAIHVSPDGEYVLEPDLTNVADWLRRADGTVALRLSDGTKIAYEGSWQPPEPEPDAQANAPVIPIRRNGRPPYQS